MQTCVIFQELQRIASYFRSKISRVLLCCCTNASSTSCENVNLTCICCYAIIVVYHHGICICNVEGCSHISIFSNVLPSIPFIPSQNDLVKMAHPFPSEMGHLYMIPLVQFSILQEFIYLFTIIVYMLFYVTLLINAVIVQTFSIMSSFLSYHIGEETVCSAIQRNNFGIGRLYLCLTAKLFLYLLLILVYLWK